MEEEEEDGRANAGDKEDTVTELAGMLVLAEESKVDE